MMERTKLMQSKSEALCSAFLNSASPATLSGIATCPAEKKVILLSQNPEADKQWLCETWPQILAEFSVVDPIRSGPFKADLEKADEGVAELNSKKIECEDKQTVNLFPGAKILQSERCGSLGCLTLLDEELHLVTVEHILGGGAGKPILLENRIATFVIARSTEINGGLTKSEPFLGDFELGKICSNSTMKPSKIPCSAIEPTGEWTDRAQFDSLCGLKVHACVRRGKEYRLREAEVVGVSACVKVAFDSLAQNNPTTKKFKEQIILKILPCNGWGQGDSGTMLFAAESREPIEKGSALGIVFAMSRGHLCATPFDAIARHIESLGKNIELVVPVA